MYSKNLGFARPIVCSDVEEPALEVPLLAVACFSKVNSLNASVSPDTVPKSGWPWMFVTSIDEPIFNLVVELFIVWNSLALSIVTNFVDVVSNS